MRKVGTLNPVVYFENEVGHIILPGNKDDARIGWRGYIKKEADTLPQIDRLAEKLDEQERRDMQMKLERDEQMFSYRRARTRESLIRTMFSSSTSNYEKEFIREYLKVSDERKRQLYSQHKRMRNYFHLREYDTKHSPVGD